MDFGKLVLERILLVFSTFFCSSGPVMMADNGSGGVMQWWWIFKYFPYTMGAERNWWHIRSNCLIENSEWS